MTGRRAWLTGGAVVAALVLALVVWLLVRPSAYVAPAPTPGPTAAIDTGGAADALRDLVTAVEDRSAGDAATPLLAAVVENAAALRVVDFSARYVTEAGGVDEDGRWQASVDLAWRFDGFDVTAAQEEVTVGFRSTPDGVVITGFGGGAGRSPLWLSGPVQVRRSAEALVLVAGSAEEADLVAQRADVAVPLVQEVITGWAGRLVVEVPAAEEGVDAALGAEPGTYADIAAVSASVDGSLTETSQLHVFVNPQVYDGLDPIGGQVVMSHEATHVATRAPVTGGVPLWLVEGFADYVALREVDLPLSTTAGQVIAQVRRDGVPQQLPGTAEFDETATHLGAAYESAWVACLVLADTAGQAGLVRLYTEVSRTGDLAGPLASITGLTEAQLTERWQARLQALADTTDPATDGT